MKDANGQSLAYCYSRENEHADRSAIRQNPCRPCKLTIFRLDAVPLIKARARRPQWAT